MPSLVAVALLVIAVPEFEGRSIIARDVQSLSVSSQVLTAASMKMTVLWAVASCSLV
jgi:hypothetical protein